MTAGRTTATSRRSTGGVHNPPVNERPPTRLELLLVMNLAVIFALTAFVAFEKVGPFGVHSARVSGALLIATGTWMLLA